MKTKKLVLNTAKVDACYIFYYVVHWAVQSQLSTMCSCWTIDVWSSKFCCGAPYRTSALGACCQVMLILRIVFFLINDMLTPSLAFKFSPSSSSSHHHHHLTLIVFTKPRTLSVFIKRLVRKPLACAESLANLSCPLLSNSYKIQENCQT